MNRRDRAIQRRGRELVKIVARRLPQEFEIPSMWDGWPAIGVGLLSRMTTTLRFMLDLQRSGLEADGSVLGRSLYEHGVYFAWLAAEPTARVLEWRRADMTQRLKLDDDAHRHGGVALTPVNRAKTEANLATLGGPLVLHTDQLAIAADKYWTGAIPAIRGHKGTYSFSGLYAWLFRGYSSLAHPSEVGLFRVTDTLGGGRVRIRIEHPEPERHGPYGMATVLFGLSLFVASKSLGWPDEQQVHALFERYPVVEPSRGRTAFGWLRAPIDRFRRP